MKFANSLDFFFSGNGVCPPGKKTDDKEGRCCVFPFEYRGHRYSGCTTVRHDKYWCSLDATYQGNWANCGEDRIVQFIRNYIWDSNGVFSISSLVKISMMSFPAFKLLFV